MTNAKTNEVKPVENKVATSEQVVLKVGTNSTKLPWPADRFGITTDLKKEGVKAVRRINGDQDKFAVLLDTMKVLAAFARESYQQQRGNRETVRRRGEVEHARAVREADKIRLATIARLETQIDYLEAQAPVVKDGK